MPLVDMTDDEKRRQLSDRKEYLNMDKYIPIAVRIAENQTSFGSNKNYLYSVDSSEEFKNKIVECITYYNTVEDNSISIDFIRKFTQIEKNLKEAHKGDIRNNAKKLRNDMSEIAELWRRAFELEKFMGSQRLKNNNYPYPPKIIYITLSSLGSKDENPEFPDPISLQIIQDVQKMMNSENNSDKTEIKSYSEITEEESINEGDNITEAKFLGILQNLQTAKQSVSYDSLRGSRSRRDNLVSLMSNYLTEERELKENNLPSEMNIDDFKNVFCNQTDDPETFINSANQIVIGMQKIGMVKNLNSIGQISKRNVISQGKYGENIARVLDNLSNYAQQAYDEAEELVNEDNNNNEYNW